MGVALEKVEKSRIKKSGVKSYKKSQKKPVLKEMWKSYITRDRSALEKIVKNYIKKSKKELY